MDNLTDLDEYTRDFAKADSDRALALAKAIKEAAEDLTK